MVLLKVAVFNLALGIIRGFKTPEKYGKSYGRLLQESIKMTWLNPTLKPSEIKFQWARGLGQQQKAIHLTQLYFLLGISVSLPNRGRSSERLYTKYCF